MTPHYVKLGIKIESEMDSLSSRTKPDAEIDHALNVESEWRASTLKSLIQGYSTQVITLCNAG